MLTLGLYWINTAYGVEIPIEYGYHWSIVGDFVLFSIWDRK